MCRWCSEALEYRTPVGHRGHRTWKRASAILLSYEYNSGYYCKHGTVRRYGLKDHHHCTFQSPLLLVSDQRQSEYSAFVMVCSLQDVTPSYDNKYTKQGL